MYLIIIIFQGTMAGFCPTRGARLHPWFFSTPEHAAFIQTQRFIILCFLAVASVGGVGGLCVAWLCA